MEKDGGLCIVLAVRLLSLREQFVYCLEHVSAQNEK